MNIHYPIPRRANRSVSWGLTAALIVVGLFLAPLTANWPVWVKIKQPAIVLVSRAAPQAVPVPVPVPDPEPPRDQPALVLSVSATPIFQGFQFRLTPEPVPTPPANP